MRKVTPVNQSVLVLYFMALLLSFSGMVRAQENDHRNNQNEAIIVSQDGSGHFIGKDEAPFIEALNQADTQGGATMIIEKGTYQIRKPLHLGSRLKIIGKPGAVLQLPEPEKTFGSSSKGTKTIMVTHAGNFRADTKIEIFRPGVENASEDATMEIASVEDNEITLKSPLPFNVPKESRVGYGHNVLNIDDEAINLDHFSYFCKVSGNKVKRSVVGVMINDASYNQIEHNIIDHCETGIKMWWWDQCPQENLNEENLMAHNVILSPGNNGVSLGERCHQNILRDNVIEGNIEIIEDDNQIWNNIRPGKSY